MTSALEKISTREKFVNNQLEHLTSEYRAVREQLEQVQQRYNKTTENVAELTSELGHISEELEQVKQVRKRWGEGGHAPPCGCRRRLVSWACFMVWDTTATYWGASHVS